MIFGTERERVFSQVGYLLLLLERQWPPLSLALLFWETSTGEKMDQRMLPEWGAEIQL